MSNPPAETGSLSDADMSSYLALVRAPFLVFTVIVISLPVAVAIEAGAFNLRNTLLAFGSVFFAHIAVNVLNIASDYRTGIDEQTDETPYSGGSDVLTAGKLSYRRAVLTAVLSIALSALLVVPLVLQFGAVILLFYGVGITLVVGYTDLFARVGLGETACGLGLTLLPTLAVGYIQSGSLSDQLLALSVPMFLVGFNLLLLNEFPDVEADRANGRVNIPIVFGLQMAGYLYLSLVGVLIVSLLYSIGTGVLPPTVAVAILPVALLVPVVRSVVLQREPTVSEDELGNHILWTQTTIGALTVGILLSIPL
jgi:1,4-dihydroxy-2-naphthoate octaprenyltransferase